jgi:L-alanine-DL-glutamate epimerase-like enolase superfamily enzyme
MDIDKVKRVAHAVNIKLEKTGGPFAALSAALKAKANGLEVMFGTMCSTQLGCTQTFQFHPLAEFMDIDGALLIKTPELKGGFRWVEDGKVIPDGTGFGMGVDARELFPE